VVPLISIGNSTFSIAVRQSSRMSRGTRSHVFRRICDPFASTGIVPPLISVIPAIALSSVDLPQPLGPTTLDEFAAAQLPVQMCRIALTVSPFGSW